MNAVTPLGIQLYSVREDIGPDRLDATLARLAALGFTHVEPYDILSDTAGLGAAIDRSGLRAATAHADIVNLDEMAILEAASQLGIATVIVPWVEPDGIADRAGVEKLATAINASAERADACGIRIGYHNHDFEFDQRIDGVPAYELLVDLLDPRVVLELDVYWAGVGGADVFELLPRLDDRVRYLHVVRDREPGNDRPVRGVDATGRMDEVLTLAAGTVEMPVIEVVAHHSDVFPLVESNAAYFRGLVGA